MNEMKDKWINDIRSRMDNYSEPLPVGLWEKIESEISTPAPKVSSKGYTDVEKMDVCCRSCRFGIGDIKCLGMVLEYRFRIERGKFGVDG